MTNVDRNQLIHDLAIAAAIVSVNNNFEAEIMTERKENRHNQVADCIQDEYEYYYKYFQKTMK